ncbi:MAG: hypothetical protein F6K35_22370 [Okeania sp. SIO2H7]|nr:hypothetical protein [Okeania sp. SIO2H7]
MTVNNINVAETLEVEKIDIEDKLLLITTELLESKENQPFLHKLFSLKASQWSDLKVLCDGLPEIESKFEELRGLLTGKIRVTWLDYPSTETENYCLIIFFVESLFWHNLAVYNKGLIIDNR